MLLKTNQYESKIGSKGEIFIPKELRKKLGFLPSIPIILQVNGSELIVTRKKLFRDLLLETPIKYHLSVKDLQEIDEEVNEALET